MKKYIQIAQWIVWAITILIGIILHFNQQATQKAIIEKDIQDIKLQNEQILKEFKSFKKETNENFYLQSELNGRVTMYIELDSRE